MSTQERGQMPPVTYDTRRKVIFSIRENPLDHYQKLKPEIIEKDRTISIWIEEGFMRFDDFPVHQAAFVGGAVIVWEILHSQDPNLPNVESDTFINFMGEQASIMETVLGKDAANTSLAFDPNSSINVYDPIQRFEENPVLMDLIDMMSERWGEGENAFLLGALSIYELIKKQVEKPLKRPN